MDLSLGPSLKGSDDQVSAISRSSSKRAAEEAELAAKVERSKSIQMLHAQKTKLEELETEWKWKDTEMLVEIKQKEAEMKLKPDEEKSNFHPLQTDSEVKVDTRHMWEHTTILMHLEIVMKRLTRFALTALTLITNLSKCARYTLCASTCNTSKTNSGRYQCCSGSHFDSFEMPSL